MQPGAGHDMFWLLRVKQGPDVQALVASGLNHVDAMLDVVRACAKSPSQTTTMRVKVGKRIHFVRFMADRYWFTTKGDRDVAFRAAVNSASEVLVACRDVMPKDYMGPFPFFQDAGDSEPQLWRDRN